MSGGGRGPGERAEAELEADGRRWRCVEAWRAQHGPGLLYFLPLEEDGEVAGDDREDRRAALAADETLDALGSDELRERLERGTPLTVTERRFRAPDGRAWLAQSVGPVWADDVASGLTGLLFTALEGPQLRERTGGGHVGEMSASELARRWRRAVEGPEEEGDDVDAAAPGAAAESQGRAGDARRHGR